MFLNAIDKIMDRYNTFDIYTYCLLDNSYREHLVKCVKTSFDIYKYKEQWQKFINITIPQQQITANNTICIQSYPVIRYIEHNLYTTNSGYYIYEFVYELDGTHDRIYILIETPKELQNDYIFFHLLRVNAMEMIRQSPLYTNNRNINNKNIDNEN